MATGGIPRVKKPGDTTWFCENHGVSLTGNQNSQNPPRKTAQYYVLLGQHMTKTISSCHVTKNTLLAMWCSNLRFYVPLDNKKRQFFSIVIETKKVFI
jgi:hypothetical protein